MPQNLALLCALCVLFAAVVCPVAGLPKVAKAKGAAEEACEPRWVPNTVDLAIVESTPCEPSVRTLVIVLSSSTEPMRRPASATAPRTARHGLSCRLAEPADYRSLYRRMPRRAFRPHVPHSWCPSVHVSACAHAYTHACAHPYIHACARVYTHIWIHAHKPGCVHVRAYNNKKWT